MTHTHSGFDNLEPLMAIIAGTFILFGVVISLWLQRLREIRERNSNALPGVDNNRFLSPVGEASEAWTEAQAEFSSYMKTARSIMAMVKSALLSLADAAIAVLFAVAAWELSGQDWQARAALGGIALLSGLGAWHFGRRVRVQFAAQRGRQAERRNRE